MGWKPPFSAGSPAPAPQVSFGGKVPAFGTFKYSELADHYGLGTNVVFGVHERPTDPSVTIH